MLVCTSPLFLCWITCTTTADISISVYTNVLEVDGSRVLRWITCTPAIEISASELIISEVEFER